MFQLSVTFQHFFLLLPSKFFFSISISPFCFPLFIYFSSVLFFPQLGQTFTRPLFLLLSPSTSSVFMRSSFSSPSPQSLSLSLSFCVLVKLLLQNTPEMKAVEWNPPAALFLLRPASQKRWRWSFISIQHWSPSVYSAVMCLFDNCIQRGHNKNGNFNYQYNNRFVCITSVLVYFKIDFNVHNKLKFKVFPKCDRPPFLNIVTLVQFVAKGNESIKQCHDVFFRLSVTLSVFNR